MEKVCYVFICLILMLQPLSSSYAQNITYEAQVLMDIKNRVKVQNMEKVCNVFICLILMLQPLSSSYAQNMTYEAQVLMDIKNRLKGTEDCIPKWGLTGNPCNWTGIHCDESYHVDGIYLSDNCTNLEGVLADFEGLTNLTHLEHLMIYDTKISGQIPNSFGTLVGLKELYLSSNHLNGSIPSELGNLINLESLKLSFNNLTGNIPSTLAQLQNLETLYLSYNTLSGEIPSTLTTLIYFNVL
ncbi:leucine-rich repeat receptor-like protein kinase family protein [Striga asiatica]|uniref:Leucine-rich repeat receptor-like protein kinase family protein n=1 Tax=Striga asiatica TaxID=4170 RepID=A0A5A7PT13_STRAF|nr:leucine-rich repeat receptor-like protein kinase family protein [Striga asiatica]